MCLPKVNKVLGILVMTLAALSTPLPASAVASAPNTQGLMQKKGRYWQGALGAVSLKIDRQRGGVVSIMQNGKTKNLTMRMRLWEDEVLLDLDQSQDPDPRIIVSEQSAQRLGVRIQFQWLDGKGRLHGDGLLDALVWHTGEVQLALGTRAVDQSVHTHVSDAWLEVMTETRGEVSFLAEREGGSASFSDCKDRRVLLKQDHGVTGFYWYSTNGLAFDELDSKGRKRPGAKSGEAPVFEQWPHLYEQWRSTHKKDMGGWGEYASGCVEADLFSNNTRMRFFWLKGQKMETGADFAAKALLGLYKASNTEDVTAHINGYQNAQSMSVMGGRFCGFDALENNVLVKAEDKNLTLTLPKGQGRRHIKLFGLNVSGALKVSQDSKDIPVGYLNLGGQTDDPYGPYLARPGALHFAVQAKPEAPTSEAIFTVNLDPEKETKVQIEEIQGAHAAYLKWDDRQMYVLRSSKLPGAPLGLFSCQTLMLHDLRVSAKEDPVMVRQPLCWFPINVKSQAHCVNVLTSLTLGGQNGDLLLSIAAQTPNQTAESQTELRLLAKEPGLVFHVESQLKVTKRWDLDGIQYINSFPMDSWQPKDWPDQFVYAKNADGQELLRRFKEPKNKNNPRNTITGTKLGLVFVQGASGRGNVMMLVTNMTPKTQAHSYRLCPAWIDSHFTLENLPVPVPSGTTFGVTYELALFENVLLSEEQARSLAAAALTAKSSQVLFRK